MTNESTIMTSVSTVITFIKESITRDLTAASNKNLIKEMDKNDLIKLCRIVGTSVDNAYAKSLNEILSSIKKIK